MNFDKEINEILKNADVNQLSESVQDGRYKYKTVGDLINELQKFDPESVVIISEKWGRGAAQYRIKAGYTDTKFLESIESERPTEEYPTKAIEISADL